MTDRKNKLLDKAYTTFIDVMLGDFPLGLLEKVAADDVMGYGTTVDEKIHDLKGLKDLANLQREQSADMNFHYNLTPVFRKTMNQENTAIIVDEIQITMQVNEEKIELQIRLSTVMDFIDGNWKVVHWHGSKPEYDSGGSDTWHKEEWQQKNEALQKLVDVKTSDLEKKNRELKIESSLERIRTTAMSMQKAEGLLDVLEILNSELKKLGFTDIRNTIINIFNDTKESFLNYDYSDYGVGGINEVDYNSHPSNIELVNKMREANDEFMITEFTGNELDEWRKWRIDQGQMPDPRLDQAVSLFYYEYSIGVGTIGISTFNSINTDQLKILNKIRNVFGLAYRRYADIEQAEAHAREGQIELALEKVRARTMAMQKSEELNDVAFVLFQQLRNLGGKLWGTGFVLCDSNSKADEAWFANEKGVLPPVKVPHTHDSAHIEMFDGWKNKSELYAVSKGGKDLKAHYDYMLSLPEVKPFFQAILDTGLSFPEWQQWNAAYFSQGYLLIISLEPYPEPQTLVRFAKVFDQAYTRFLDLQKAEAQAREGQIELALERVRARTMAMQKSEELGDVAIVLFKELNQLVDNLWTCGFVLCEKDRDEDEWWLSTEDGFIPAFYLPNVGDKTHKNIYSAWRRGETYHTEQVEGAELAKHYEWLLRHLLTPGHPFVF